MRELIVLLILVLAPPAWSGEAQMILESEIEVSKRAQSTWADYARVRGRDEHLLRELQKMPWTGDDMKNVTAGLRSLRARVTAAGGGRLRVVLPKELRISRVEGFSVAEFRRKVENHMAALCEDCLLQWLPGFMSVPKIADDWRIDESALKVSGQLVVPVLSSAGTAWLPIKIKLEKPALVLKRAVTAGERIDESLVETRLVDISNGAKRPLALSQLGLVETARGMPAGQALQESDARAPEAVKRGQLVKVIGGTGEFEIAVQAVAEAPGRIGELIRVKNTESGRLLSGRVLEAGVVRIE